MRQPHFFLNMKKFLLLSLIIFVTTSLYCQHIRFNWQSCPTFDNQWQETYDIIQAGDGFFILRNRHLLYPEGYNSICIEKTDLFGNNMWEKYYTSSTGAAACNIMKADENNYYILGVAANGGVDVTYDPYPGSRDFWIIKIDSSGNKIWDKIVGGNGADQQMEISVTADGGVVAVGIIATLDGQSYEGDATNYYGFWDFWVVKLNKDDGHIEWDFTLGSSLAEYGYCVEATSDGGCIAGGALKSVPDGNVLCYNQGYQAVLVKLNAQGEQEWQNCYGSSYEEGAICILETDDGYIIGADSNGDDQDLEGAGYHLGYDVNENRLYDIWIYKIDKEGNLLWSKCFGGSKNEIPHKLFQTSNGDIIVFGVTQSIDGDVTHNYLEYEGYTDIWMLKLSAQGDLLWQRCIGAGGDQDIEKGVAMLDDYNFIIAANIHYGNDGDITCGPTQWATNAVSWVASITDTTGTSGAGEQEEASHNIKVYTNPANEYAVFRYTLPADTREALLQIRDLSGRPVETLTLQGRVGEKLWDARDVSAGIYIYLLKAGKLSVNGKLTVIK